MQTPQGRARAAQQDLYQLIRQEGWKAEDPRSVIDAVVSTADLAQGRHNDIIRGSATFAVTHRVECRDIVQALVEMRCRGRTPTELYETVCDKVASLDLILEPVGDTRALP